MAKKRLNSAVDILVINLAAADCLYCLGLPIWAYEMMNKLICNTWSGSKWSVLVLVRLLKSGAGPLGTHVLENLILSFTSGTLMFVKTYIFVQNYCQKSTISKNEIMNLNKIWFNSENGKLDLLHVKYFQQSVYWIYMDLFTFYLSWV